MNEHGKSDNSIVPRKSRNNGSNESAEAVEGRELAKGNLFLGKTHEFTGCPFTQKRRISTSVGNTKNFFDKIKPTGDVASLWN